MHNDDNVILNHPQGDINKESRFIVGHRYNSKNIMILCSYPLHSLIF